jgi:hypothetical protein
MSSGFWRHLRMVMRGSTAAQNTRACSFIKANLLVEVTAEPLLAKCFTWLLRRHTMVSYALYMAGMKRLSYGMAGVLPQVVRRKAWLCKAGILGA